MNIGTWNLQGIGEKMEKVIQEMNSINMNIVVLTKTKKKRSGTEIIGSYVHIFSGVPKHQRARRGVLIMIHKKHRRKITDFKMIENENILRVNININQTLIIILGLYAISNDEPSTTKY